MPILQQQVPLTSYAFALLLKDSNSFIAKDFANKRNYIENLEALMLKKFIEEKYYLLNVEQLQEKAIEEYRDFIAHISAIQKQQQPIDDGLNFTVGQSFPKESMEKLVELMERLANTNYRLNELYSIKSELENKLALPVEMIAVQSFKEAQANYMDNLISQPIELPNGISLTLDPQDEEVIEMRDRFVNRLLPDQLRQKCPSFKAFCDQQIKGETEYLTHKGYSIEDASILAEEIVEDRMKKADQIKQKILGIGGPAYLYQQTAARLGQQLSMVESTILVKAKELINLPDVVAYINKYKQEQATLAQHKLYQAELQQVENQIIAEKLIKNEDEELACIILSGYFKFKNENIYENSRTAMNAYLHTFFKTTPEISPGKISVDDSKIVPKV